MSSPRQTQKAAVPRRLLVREPLYRLHQLAPLALQLFSAKYFALPHKTFTFVHFLATPIRFAAAAPRSEAMMTPRFAYCAPAPEVAGDSLPAYRRAAAAAVYIAQDYATFCPRARSTTGGRTLMRLPLTLGGGGDAADGAG